MPATLPSVAFRTTPRHHVLRGQRRGRHVVMGPGQISAPCRPKKTNSQSRAVVVVASASQPPSSSSSSSSSSMSSSSEDVLREDEAARAVQGLLSWAASDALRLSPKVTVASPTPGAPRGRAWRSSNRYCSPPHRSPFNSRSSLLIGYPCTRSHSPHPPRP